MAHLTIIIPHYNTPDYLRKLLDTIPASDSIQTIVIDDKSDAELETYKALKQDEAYRRVTFLANTTDKKGAGVCRNIGLENAKGTWVLFADADDFFMGGFYNKVEAFFSGKNDVVFFMPTSQYLETGEDAPRTNPYRKITRDYLNKSNRTNELRLRYAFHVPWSKLYSADFIKKNHIFFDETIVGNDVMFSAKTGHHMAAFDVSADTIYCVTEHSHSLTKKRSAKNYDMRLDVFLEWHNFVKEHLSKDDFRRLAPSGVGLLYSSFVYKLGFKKTMAVIRKMKRHQVKLFRVKKDFSHVKPFLFKSGTHTI